MELSTLQWMTDALGSWFERLTTRGQVISAREEEALKAFLAALQETRFFLRGDDREKPKMPDGQQRRLSDLWLEAARLVRRLDSNLADRCNAKARYWSDPAGWTPKDKNEANILIESMEDEARRLLLRRARR